VRATLDELLTHARFADLEGTYLAVTLTDDHRPRDPMDRLRTRFPHVLTLGHEPESTEATAGTYTERLRGLSDLEISVQFVHDLRGVPATPDEELLLRQAMEQIRMTNDAGPDAVAVGADH